MNDEDIKETETVGQTVDEPVKTNKEAYLEYAKGRLGDNFNPDDDESVYGGMLDFMKKGDESEAKISEALKADPRLAQVLSDVVSKKRGSAASLARYFGKDFLNAEEGSDEWNEIENSEKERMEELDSMRSRKDLYDKNLEESAPVLEEFAKSKGIDLDEFLGNVYDKILSPVFEGTYTPDILDMLYKALSYDNDVEDAFQAGNVKGRNEKIDKMKKDVGDGLPKLGTTGSSEKSKMPDKNTKKKVGSVWDV